MNERRKEKDWRGLLAASEEGGGTHASHYGSTAGDDGRHGNADGGALPLSSGARAVRHAARAVPACLFVACIALGTASYRALSPMAHGIAPAAGVRASVAALVPLYVTRGGDDPASPWSDEALDSDPAPFSLTSPARVGVDEYVRSPATRPGDVFGSLRLAGEVPAEERDNVTRIPRRPPLPTNSWYQSLLVGSVSEGRLTEANRVYTLRE